MVSQIQSMMRYNINRMWVYCILTILLQKALLVDINTTAINQTRISARTTVCSASSFNISTEDVAATDSILSASKSLYGSMKLASNIYNSYGLQSNTISQSTIAPIILSIIPQAICLLGILLLWPCLCCCCANPQQHPACACCRKPQKEVYKRFELKWTSYILIIVTLTCLTGAVVGLLKGAEVFKYYNNAVCKLAAIPDDTINGRVSDDGFTFFIGLNPLASQLDSFNTKLNTFYTQSDNCFSTASTIQTDGTNILTAVEAQYTSFVDTVYTSAFKAADGSTDATVTSNFKALYMGPTSDSTKVTGIMKSQLSYYFQLVNSALNPMLTAYNYLKVTKTQPTVSSLLTAQATAIRATTGPIQTNTTTMVNFLYRPQITSQAQSSLLALYSIILGLCILLLLSAVLLAFCSVVRVRYVIYCTCGFLILCGIVTGLLLVGVSIMIPLGYQTCTYLDDRVNNPTNIVNFIKTLQGPNLSPQIQACISGDKNIIKTIDTTLNDVLDNVATITTNTQTFSTLLGNYSTDNLKTTFVAARDPITAVYNASKLDVDDTVSKAFFTALASKSYTAAISCDLSKVSSDCWVPSFTAGNCSSSLGRMPPCSNLADISVACPLGCYEIQNTFINVSGDSAFASNLATRYGSGCNYVTYIVNNHNNYNVPKRSAMSTCITNVNNTQTTTLTYDNRISTLKGNLATFKAIMETNFDLITNMDSGALYGRSCSQINQTITSFRNAFCSGLYGSLYYNYVCLLLISWSILLIACCSTCAGVRHYRHLKLLQLSMNYSGVPVNMSQTKIKVLDNKDDQ